MYDTQSNSSAVLASARKAVGDGVQAIISNDVYFDTAAPYLAENKIPVFGFGISLGFYGPDKQTFFSPMGNWIAYQSNVGMKYLVDQGHQKIAVLSDPNPGNANAAHAIANAVPTVGGQLIYENYGVDDTNSGALLAVAQAAKDAGAQAVYTNFYGTAPAQLQANLNQIDAKAVVLNGSLGYSPDIPKQFGSSVEGLTSEVFTATWLSPAIPGVKTYMDAMTKYAPDSLREQLGAHRVGHDAAVRWGHREGRQPRRRRGRTSPPPPTRCRTSTVTACMQPVSVPADARVDGAVHGLRPGPERCVEAHCRHRHQPVPLRDAGRRHGLTTPRNRLRRPPAARRRFRRPPQHSNEGEQALCRTSIRAS